MESLRAAAAEAPVQQKIPDQESRLLAALFEAFRSGEDGEGLVLHCHAWIVRSIRRFSSIDPASAEDLAQQAWVRVLEKKDQLRDPYVFKSWLRTIVRRITINEMLRGYRCHFQTSVDAGFPTILAREPSPAVALIDQSQREEMHMALRGLKDLDRKTLEAFYFHHQSLIEMAAAFHAPVGTIKRRLYVARKRLRKALIESVSDASEWTDNPQ